MTPIQWIEKNCKHLSSSKIAFQKVKLLPFQKEILRELFDKNGNFKKSFFFINSKRGIAKTNFLAWVYAYLFIYKKRQNLPVVSGRLSQTKECFKVLSETIELALSNKEKKNYEFLAEKVVNKKTKARVFCLSSNSKTIYAIPYSDSAIFEEIHSWPEREGDRILNAVSNKMSENSCQFFASNPAEQKNPFYENWYKHFLEHKNHKDYCVRIYKADSEKVDIFDKKQWKKADPTLGIITSEKSMKRMAELARMSPEKKDDFLRSQLGINITRAHESFVDTRKFIIQDFDYDINSLPVSVGIDLSINEARAVCSFTRKLPDNRGFLFKFNSYLPRESLDKLDDFWKEKNLEYEKKGFLILQDTPVIDQEEILSDIKEEIKDSTERKGAFVDMMTGGAGFAKKLSSFIETTPMKSTALHQTPLEQNLQKIVAGNMFFMERKNQLVIDDFDNTLLKYGKNAKNLKLMDKVNSRGYIDSCFACAYSIFPYELKEQSNWNSFVM